MHLSALMLTTAPSLGSQPQCSFHYHSLQKRPKLQQIQPKRLYYPVMGSCPRPCYGSSQAASYITSCSQAD